MSIDNTKIGKASQIWGIIVFVSAFIFSFFAFYLFIIPIVLGVIALKRKDKLGYYGIGLGLLAWLISWFVMPYVKNMLYPF